MNVRHEFTIKYDLISWIKKFEAIKSLRNILRRLKLNVSIFRKIIYLFNSKDNITPYPSI